MSRPRSLKPKHRHDESRGAIHAGCPGQESLAPTPAVAEPNALIITITVTVVVDRFWTQAQTRYPCPPCERGTSVAAVRRSWAASPGGDSAASHEVLENPPSVSVVVSS